MRISVLMSLYAKENPAYFDRSMKSIWDDQTRKPDEIVLVEDGPITSALESIVSLWQEKIPVLKIVKLEKNCGLAIALNEGAKVCDCDYIARMDTDDISFPERFQIQEEYLMEHPEIVVLGGGMQEFSDEDGCLPPRLMPLTTEEIRKAICKTSPFVHPSVCIKKMLFDKGLSYNPKCRRYQDLEYWFRILAAGYQVANLDKVLIQYRKDPLLYKKRNKTAWAEMKIVFKGIYLLYGTFSWQYIYPLLHFIFRQLPPQWCLFLYKHLIVNYWNK